MRCGDVGFLPEKPAHVVASLVYFTYSEYIVLCASPAAYMAWADFFVGQLLINSNLASHSCP